MTVIIELSKKGTKNAGKYTAIVDDIDGDLDNYNWTFAQNTRGATQYAYRQRPAGKYKQIAIQMQREIMERILGHAIPDGMQVDHCNMNGLDNRRANLRLATHQQNKANTGKLHRNNTSEYKGVYRRDDIRYKNKDYIALIRAGSKQRYLGTFKTEIAAHEAYCRKAVELHGKFANFGENSPFTPEMFMPDRTPIQLPLFALESESAA